MKTPLVVIAGGSSAAGVTVASALLGAGMRVLTVGSDAGRIQAAARLTDGAVPLVCNLGDPDDVADLLEDIHEGFGPVDGLIHLVGGWRGGDGIAGQSDADWDFLHTTVLTTLRTTSRAFYPDLAASPVGRLAIVSSTTVTDPGAGDANYASIKAAAETWVRSVAAGFASGAPAAGEVGTTAASEGMEGGAAGVVLVVKALVDDAMRARSPQRRFPGFTDVAVLGQAVAGLFSTPAAQLNGARIILDSNS
ncbi:SDR family NAD(P)-dependent oxidoreductase [Arthrobacter sp. Sr24]